ncbi:MAG: putative oxidoreductase [Glaciihabitans sp.]|nr:putative oxidoreductase [Glaciihabitans sp.]
MTDLLTTANLLAAPVATPLGEDALSALFTDARTPRVFADTPVSNDELAAIWDLAKWAPTASNLQPLRVLFVQSDEGRARLVSHMSEGNQARVASAPAVAILAVDTRFHEHAATVMPVNPALGEMLEANPEARERMGSFNGAMQAGYFILATRAQGLTAGPMGGFDAAAVDADFFPDGRLHAILVVQIGHPGENAWHGRLPRLEQETVVAWA